MRPCTVSLKTKSKFSGSISPSKRRATSSSMMMESCKVSPLKGSFSRHRPWEIYLKDFPTTSVSWRGITSMYIRNFSRAQQTRVGPIKGKNGIKQVIIKSPTIAYSCRAKSGASGFPIGMKLANVTQWVSDRKTHKSHLPKAYPAGQ